MYQQAERNVRRELSRPTERRNVVNACNVRALAKRMRMTGKIMSTNGEVTGGVRICGTECNRNPAKAGRVVRVEDHGNAQEGGRYATGTSCGGEQPNARVPIHAS